MNYQYSRDMAILDVINVGNASKCTHAQICIFGYVIENYIALVCRECPALLQTVLIGFIYRSMNCHMMYNDCVSAIQDKSGGEMT